jgi:hypothetical protein
MPGAKKDAPSTMKRIIPAIAALAMKSSVGTQELSPHDHTPEVQ